MSTDLSLSCTCGQFQATLHEVSAANGNRVVCHCLSCQAFAHYLERADEILDTHGGTDIFQTSPARLDITQGAEQLTCMRLASKGLTRWYAKCCKTPIGNTMATPSMPFVGLFSTFMKPHDNSTLDNVLGPVRGRIFGQHAKGDTTEIKQGFSPLMLLNFGKILLKGRFRGDHKKSLFFDQQTQAPIVTPYVLSGDELRAVEAARDS